MISKLSSLSLQYNELSGSIPQGHLKNLFRLRALQLEGNSFTGTIDKHSLLCQMTRKYRDRDLPKGQAKYEGERLLRFFTATCIPAASGVPATDRLECACCTECFGIKQRHK